MNSKGYRGPHRKRKVVSTEDKSDDQVENSPLVKIFQQYQAELDTRYDKHERLVKKSRDLTIESKRIIFLLHRVISPEESSDILKEAEERLGKLCNSVIAEISSELTKQEVYQFVRAFSPGLQEFVEAFSLYFFLKHGRLISLAEVHNQEFLQQVEPTNNDPDLPSPNTTTTLSDILTPTDYILGIADLTGELMRKCINSVASGNIEEPFDLCLVLKDIHNAMITCNQSGCKELRRKFFTLKGSLGKVENACYAIRIRGSEMPQHMLADFFSDGEEYREECEL